MSMHSNTYKHYKPTYILVVSDEGCWEGTNFYSAKARFRELLGPPEKGKEKIPQKVQNQIKFFTDYDSAQKFMLDELEKGHVPHTLFLDMFIMQRDRTSPCTAGLYQLLTEKGIKRPYYTMSSNINDFNDSDHDMYRGFIDGTKSLSLDKPNEVINRILGASADLDLHRLFEKTGDEQVDSLSNDNRRIILATSDKTWVKNLRNHIHFFDRFVLVCESQESFYKTLETVTSKKRNLVSIVVDEDLPPGKTLHYAAPAHCSGSEVLRHLAEDKEGQSMVNNYFRLGHASPTISFVSKTLASQHYTHGDGRDPLNKNELNGLGITKSPKIWKISPIRHGDIGAVRQAVQSIWADHIQAVSHMGLSYSDSAARI